MFMRRAYRIVENGYRDQDGRGLTSKEIDGLANDIMRAAIAKRDWSNVPAALTHLKRQREFAERVINLPSLDLVRAKA